MTFEIIVTIKDAMFQIFGGAMFLPLILIAVIALVLLALKGGKILFLIVLTPLVTTIFVFGSQSGFFAGLTAGSLVVAVAMWMGLGLVMAGVFWAIIR